LVRKNSLDLKTEKDVKIIYSDAKKLPKNDKTFDLIFIDPPYKDDYVAILASLVESGWVKKNSLVVAEFQTGRELQTFEGFVKLDERRYGKTVFVFYSAV